jgi:hypothetical protein
MNTTASPELLAAIAAASAIYADNSAKLCELARQLDNTPAYLAAKAEVARLYTIHQESNPNE